MSSNITFDIPIFKHYRPCSCEYLLNSIRKRFMADQPFLPDRIIVQVYIANDFNKVGSFYINREPVS